MTDPERATERIEGDDPTMTRRPLLLRPWAEADAANLRRIIDEDLDHLKPWLGWTLEEPRTLEQTRERLRRYIDLFGPGESRYWAITPLHEPDEILGGAHMHSRVGPQAHDIGYWVRRNVKRQGIASAAAAALVVYAFTERGVDLVVIHCDPGNTASAALAMALGFEPAGPDTLAFADGTPRPVLRFELPAGRYRTNEDVLREKASRVRLLDAAP